MSQAMDHRGERLLQSVLLGCLLLPAAGCKQKKLPKLKLGKTPFVSAEARTWSTPSDEECLAYAKKFKEILESGDQDAFMAQFDWDTLVERGVGGIEGRKARIHQQYLKGFKKGLSKQGSFVEQLLAAVSQGGRYTLLHVRSKGREKHAVFRMLLTDGGLNYHLLPLVKKADGKVIAVDFYIALSGEYLSLSLRRTFLPLAVHQSRSLLDRLTGVESDFMQHFDKFQKMADAVRKGQHAEVIRICSQFPESLQREKNVLIMRVAAATKLGDATYMAALDDFREFYPKERCIDLLSIDYFLLKERYDEALACVDRLDKWIGGDPYLLVMKANLSVLKEDFESARKWAQEAIDADETLVEAYWALVTASLGEKDFDETVRVLNTIAKNFALEFQDLTEIEEYAEFVKSPQYEEWLKARK